MEDLEAKMHQASLERQTRYPLLSITDNLKEIREIAEKTQDYMVELNPELLRPQLWESIPRIAMEFIEHAFAYMGDRKTTEFGEICLPLGKIMTVGVEYATTEGSDKEGTFNPFIRIGKEMDYDYKDEPYDNSIDVNMASLLREEQCENLMGQFFDNRKEIKTISQSVTSILLNNYGIKFLDWTLVPLTFVAFFRKAKEYLISHKDDGECGVEINFGDAVTFGIEKEGWDDDISYRIYIIPGQKPKLNNAKDDSKTEL
jgi:hypothetical protein